jgi:hypothetical protein
MRFHALVFICLGSVGIVTSLPITHLSDEASAVASVLLPKEFLDVPDHGLKALPSRQILDRES